MNFTSVYKVCSAIDSCLDFLKKINTLTDDEVQMLLSAMEIIADKMKDMQGSPKKDISSNN